MIKKLIFGATALLMAQGSGAVVTTVNGSFTATNWSIYFGSPSAPIDPLFLNYTATFDTNLSYLSDSSVVTVHSSNIPYAFSFTFDAGDNIFILATNGSSRGCGHPPGSFCAFFADFTTGLPFFVEQSPASGGGWLAGTIAAANVPEPASWALLIAGFGLTGAVLRRRRETVAA